MARIAVVEDNDLMRRIIVEFLTGAGHDAAGCANPAEAAAMIIAHKAELAVLDYAMPVMNGTEVLADLRSRKETRELPVIFLSGTDALRFAPDIPGEPLIRFMTKPPDFERLQGLIADLLSAG